MTHHEKIVITVTASILAPLEKVWECWTNPIHVIQWNNASADWHTPAAKNDLRVGGRFEFRMEARDGSMGFDFGGVYNEVKEGEFLEYTLDDERKVSVSFAVKDGSTIIVEKFEAENTHPIEMQKSGWQSILDHFKKYTESIA